MDAAVRALSCCCLVGDQDSHQITYPGDPKLEEGFGGRPLCLPPSPPGQTLKPSPGTLGPSYPEPARSSRSRGASSARMGPHSARSGAGSAPSSARSLTPEERQKEKERLQDMVKEFAKAVVQGQQCHWLPSSAGAPRPAIYAFDQALRNFTVRPEEPPKNVLNFEMVAIQDIVKDVRRTPFQDLLRLPPCQLTGDELDRRFICIQYQNAGDEKMENLGLLLPNPFERERFYTCMKILRWAMETRQGKP